MDNLKVRKTTFIYALSCPTSGDIRYIGKADCLFLRLKSHLNEANKRGNYRRHWIKSLVDDGLIPEIEIIDECPIEEWGFWEQHYIDLFRSWGLNLVNTAAGGKGGRVSFEANEKRKASLRGQRFTEERKDKIRQKAPGRKASHSSLW
ncbi:GIY-YIG nuclease family protein [Spirosoma sp.]|uniref:GIY-YIG nuclease family protein n=1 Tax=Spirosoma sp. TaxID=1899569 RepID=UPI00261640EB|nr:GIY-YIG nuclease family protein [Spirosoma sp.]MCX6218321.1 GIY-YIG nuclease family protein [Spirosoma sp.]